MPQAARIHSETPKPHKERACQHAAATARMTTRRVVTESLLPGSFHMTGIVSSNISRCGHADVLDYAPLPLHPSMDLVSLVNLRPQFDRFVRPYLPLHILRPDLHPPPNKDEQVDDQVDAGSGAKKRKKKDGNQRRLEKGYEGLIEECIGENNGKF